MATKRVRNRKTQGGYSAWIEKAPIRPGLKAELKRAWEARKASEPDLSFSAWLRDAAVTQACSDLGVSRTALLERAGRAG